MGLAMAATLYEPAFAVVVSRLTDGRALSLRRGLSLTDEVV
jgi:hypothetical protein